MTEVDNDKIVRTISVIVPMLNEEDHIVNLVDDIAEQDFTGEIELLVADGRSADESVERLTEAARRSGLKLAVIDNPQRWVSTGLNACIQQATGDLIVRMDAHTRYPSDYLRLSAKAAEETDAWNIGGVVVPIGRTAMERAVGCAMDGPFGGVHWTRFAGSRERVQVDMVHCGAYRPIGFQRAGLFDETFVRNQDDDLAYRLRDAGGTILLDPAIRQYYVPRGSLRSVFRQYYQYGFWKVFLQLKHRHVISGRSLAPQALLASLVVLGLAATFMSLARWLLLAELVLYATFAIVAAGLTIRRHNESWTLLPRVATTFPMFHLGYGIGAAAGWLRVVRRGHSAERRAQLARRAG
jgi:succinoglycan biosynthesis protein ExoA